MFINHVLHYFERPLVLRKVFAVLPRKRHGDGKCMRPIEHAL